MNKIWLLYEQLLIFFLFFGHILALVEIYYNVFNFLVTFLLLTTNTALYNIPTSQFIFYETSGVLPGNISFSLLLRAEK